MSFSTLFFMRATGLRLATIHLALWATLPLVPGKARAETHVQASLVAATASIQPGQPFIVALRLAHEPHWHTYWLNPGTGLATTLTWTLPPGFSAGTIQWPAPYLLKDRADTVIGNGYEEETFLPVTLTAPADLKPGTSVSLHAKAEWLMCKDVCMPGNAEVALTLPVSTDAPALDTLWGAKVAATFAGLPRVDAGWNVAAIHDAKTVTLAVTPANGIGQSPSNLHFFSDDNFVAYELPQVVIPDGHGGFLLTMQISPDGPVNPPKLLGILTSETGWLADGSLRGLHVEAAFGARATYTFSAVVPLAPKSALLGTLLLALIGGLTLNLMPCVFPVLGIKILGFVNQSGKNRRKIMVHGLVFALGVLLSFWVLAAVLFVLRASGAQLGWGFQLQSPAFVFGMAAFLLLFALNLSGLFEVGLSATGVGGYIQMKEGFAGSFFTGALATLVATPCSAPFLAPALGAALALSAGQSFLVFTAIALGLALPYLLLSIFPSALELLPRPGEWMETFKQFMAFPLYATVGWLLWVLAGQTKDDDNALLLISFGFVLVAMAAWAYGRFGQVFGKPARQTAGRVFAAALLAAGLYTGWPRTAEAAPAGSYQVTWGEWSPEAIAAAQQAGKLVYVDFTARWCATCQTNKATVFHNDDVLAELKRRNVMLLRGDWTNRDAKITAELARWKRSAVPFNLIYAPGKADPVILPELLTPGQVLAALRKL